MQNQSKKEENEHAYKIKEVKNRIYNLKKEMKEMQEELNKLKEVCPHIETREEYDDDFHKPHFYKLCLICGEELKYNG